MSEAIIRSEGITEIKEEISRLRSDLRKFMERSNQQHVDTVLSAIRDEYSALFADSQLDAACEGLTRQMDSECPMREKCYTVFYEFLKETSGHIRGGSVTDEIVCGYRTKLEELKKTGKLENCPRCFAETARLFEKQVDLMQSLGIYSERRPDQKIVPAISDEEIVSGILEPLASVQRLQMLRNLASGTMTFTELSKLTDLRGGNLLFHVKKLLDAGLVIQRHERGDYMITAKGFRVLQGLSALSGHDIQEQPDNGPS